MARLNWAPQAVQDLEDICEYIARSSEHYARTIAQGVRKLARSIPKQPRLGAMVPDYEQDDIRERLFHNYRIIYRIRDDVIEIVRIIHGARLLPRTPPE